ncbi:hypothetical protein IT409_02035 [Candidatus Falkowbacteria bacterium]|nr:hypothetical protein [Candidatus Falkowbacteria bacterium]
MKIKSSMSINQAAMQLGITQEELAGILQGKIHFAEATSDLRHKLSTMLEVEDEVASEMRQAAISLESVAQNELDHIKLEVEEFLRIVAHIFTNTEKRFFYLRATTKDDGKLGRQLKVNDEELNQIHDSLTQKCTTNTFVEIAYKIFVSRDFVDEKLKHWLRVLIVLDSSIDLVTREVLMYYCLENVTKEKISQLAIRNSELERMAMIQKLESAYECVEKKYPYVRALFTPIASRFEKITLQ